MTFLLIVVALVTKLLIGWLLSVMVMARKMATILSKATSR